MTVAGGRFEPMTTGVLLDRALQLYTANFALMLGITAVACVPFYLIMVVVESALGFNAESGGLTAVLYFVALSSFGRAWRFPSPPARQPTRSAKDTWATTSPSPTRCAAAWPAFGGYRWQGLPPPFACSSVFFC